MTQRKTWFRGLLVALVFVLCLSALAGDPQQRAEAEEEQEIVSSYPYTTVTREKVNLRQSRNTKSTLLKKIPAGAEITVLSKNGNWVEVTYGGKTGWLLGKYIVLKTVKKIKVTPTPTPVPTLTPEEDSGGYPILKRGSTGRYVRSLQEALIELGFLTGTADGNFGDATEKAVIAFQKKNSYPDTGLMDANIQAFLYSGKPKNVQGTATTIKTLSPVPGATMKKNCTGWLVGELQQMLYNLGYYTAKTYTNKYDDNTQKAVKAFQKKNNLKADGIAGAETRTLLESGGLPADATATPVATDTPAPTAAPTWEIPKTTVKNGSSGKDARLVQNRLKELGYYRGAVDGSFGRASVNALKSFQANNGLKDDGVAGSGTYVVLFSATAIPFTMETATPAAGTVTPAPSTGWKTLRQGMSGNDVKQLQENLVQLGYMSGNPDGKYGAKTTLAVKAFQKANKLTADGVAGATTQKKLYSGTAVAAPTAKPTATPKPGSSSSESSSSTITGTLKRGSTGSSVSALQSKLIELGYLTGKADGVYGSKTAAAVKAFQKAYKLTADGVAGSKTISKLENTQKGSSATAAPAATATPAPTAAPAPVTGRPSPSRVIYANWYTTVKAVCKAYPYCTVYDYNTNISWQIHIFSVGAHADFEPVTANDTARMQRAFGGQTTWTPKPVWVIFSDGSVYMASVHDTPHGTSHITDNNFAGHACLHFPRTQDQVTAIGPYATSHQECIDKGWAATQKLNH